MEDFVPFEIAKKLKEKGFREKVNAYYGKWENLFDVHPALDMNDCDYRASAPTISQVLKWLREEKYIHIEPCILTDCDTDEDGKIINEYIHWSFSIMSTETGDMIYFEYERIDFRRFDTYEQAALAGIQYVLYNLI